MHDEVSDTENIRKNLAIERMIVEGCDILLDTSQTFVRQGMSSSAASTPDSRSPDSKTPSACQAAFSEEVWYLCWVNTS